MASTLEQLMDPKVMDIQARYENARLAVNMGWTIASKKYDTLVELSTTARWIADEIKKDFDETLNVLSEERNGHKAESPTLPRPS